MKFNEKLTQLRKSKNLSQEELGNELGVARQTVSKWELGETTPEMDKLIKMSEIFEISLDELIKDKEIDTNINTNTNTNSNDPNNTNTQKLAGLTIKIIKGILIFIAILSALYLVLIVSSLVRFNDFKSEKVETVVENEETIFNNTLENKDDFTKTYNILNVADSDDENYLYLTIKQFQNDEVETVKVLKTLANGVEANKNYEFTFQYGNKNIEDNIKSIFENATLVQIKGTDKTGLEQVQDTI